MMQRSPISSPKRRFSATMAVVLFATMCCGCRSLIAHKDAIPASRLSCHLRATPRECQMPFPFTSLGQERPKAHLIGAGDQLSIYVYGVIPSVENESPVIQRMQSFNQRYYPPRGSVVGATIGLPMEVDAEGFLDLPIIGRIEIADLTLTEASQRIKMLYRQQQVVKEGAERVHVSLITPRVRRIVVIREDTPESDVELVPAGVVDHIHRGSAEVVDLPIYENDVLHALAATGGLPGTDAARELWVFKRRGLTNPHAICPEELRVHAVSYHDDNDRSGQVLNIPLVGCPGEGTPYTCRDVVLEDGDVVFLPRREEYFYTGGLIGGARIPLPRDRDVDVLEAISLARGSVRGPVGKSGTALATGSPGNTILPSEVTVVRKLRDGRQFSILVDLRRATADQKERILIQPDDLIITKFKTHEAIANSILNWLNLNVTTGRMF